MLGPRRNWLLNQWELGSNEIVKIAPVLLIIYKRYDTALKVVESIRPAKPERIYIAANAPANHSEVENFAVHKARSITSHIDWNCEVVTLFREAHLNVQDSVPQSISWFFQHESEGIILEDDCVVSPEFLYFSTEMLSLYKNHPRVFQISACNPEGITKGLESDYFFSKFPLIWGWATWSRVWNPFKSDDRDFSYRTFWKKLKVLFPNPIVRLYWLFSDFYTRSGRRETWDTSWIASVWLRDGLTILPQGNMVSNVGFGAVSTNTQQSSCKWANMPIRKLPPPWKAPKNIDIELKADRFLLNTFYGAGKPWIYNLFKIIICIVIPLKIKKHLKKVLY